MKIFCLTWAPSSRRMDEIATELHAERWDCNILFKVKPLAPLRYLLMTFRTLIELAKREPDIIIAQNPPVFLPILCWIYRVFTKRPLIIDHHCIWSEKAFQNPILKKTIRSFEKFIIKRVNLNTSPHDVWTEKLRKLGNKQTKVFTIIDYVEKVPIMKVSREKFCKTRYLVVYPGGTGVKERPDVAIEAVKQLENATLIITGREKFLKKVLHCKSHRIVFSGFLPDEEYFGLLKEADIVINTTDELYTIPHFIYETIALGTPIISSLNPPIVKLFNKSICIIKENTPENLKQAIQDVLQNRKKWAQKAQRLQGELGYKRQKQIKELIAYISKIKNR